jgi:hypothetical protein
MESELFKELIATRGALRFAISLVRKNAPQLRQSLGLARRKLRLTVIPPPSRQAAQHASLKSKQTKSLLSPSHAGRAD